MPNHKEDKIDFYAQSGVNYIYIVFKMYKKCCGASIYLAEAEKVKKILNENIHACNVALLFANPGAAYPACAAEVDEAYGFNRYFKVMLTGDKYPAHLVNSVMQLIAEQDFIELVYPAGEPVEASQCIGHFHNPNPYYDEYYPRTNPANLAIPNFYQFQNYLRPPAFTTGGFRIGGINVHGSWGNDGADGRDVTIMSYEPGAWDTNHVNLPRARAFSLGATNVNSHGTSSVGVMAARWMSPPALTGIVGIAFNARVAFAASPIQNLLNAYHLLIAGDIVQVGIEILGGTESGCTGYCAVPMEYENAWYNIFRALTDKGVHVILAAGNGSINLDHPAFQGKFNRNVRDSGAIYVGAIDPTTVRRDFTSNFGSRIDSSSWGRHVVTASFGSGNLFNERNAWYVNNYAGTSAATPIVAGAAASLSGIAKARSRALPPRLLRQIFTQTGTAFLNNDSLIMGTQPNLGAALARFNAIS